MIIYTNKKNNHDTNIQRKNNITSLIFKKTFNIKIYFIYNIFTTLNKLNCTSHLKYKLEVVTQNKIKINFILRLCYDA